MPVWHGSVNQDNMFEDRNTTVYRVVCEACHLAHGPDALSKHLAEDRAAQKGWAIIGLGLGGRTGRFYLCPNCAARVKNQLAEW